MGGSRQRAGSYKAAFNDFLYLSFTLTRCAILKQSVHLQESAAYLVLLKDTLNPICNGEDAGDIHEIIMTEYKPVGKSPTPSKRLVA